MPESLLGRFSGVGSWPGTEPGQASAAIVNALTADGGIPHLPELPARGPGADMVGRTAALLPEIAVETHPAGWRIAARPGHVGARARRWLSHDVEALAEHLDGYAGALKVQLTGPWTLAAALELPLGEKALTDSGATRDLVDNLDGAVAAHVAQVRRLIPGAPLIVQVDEPLLLAVLTGAVRNRSGRATLPAIERQHAGAALARVVRAAREAAGEGGQVTLHCCAPGVLTGASGELLRGLSLDGASLDVSLVDSPGWEALGQWVEDGRQVWAGALPTGPADADASSPDPADVASRLLARWDELGLERSRLAQVVLTPACGLAGLAPGRASALLRAAREAGARLADVARS